MKRALLLPLLAIALNAPTHAQQPAPETVAPQVAKVSIPDVRDLEYRAATLANPVPRSPWAEMGKDEVSTGHFWIVPARNGANPQGIGWDGVVYDLKNVGEKASWLEDAKQGLLPSKPNEPYVPRLGWEFAARTVARYYLEQLGAPELAKPITTDVPGGFAFQLDPLQNAWLRNLRDAGTLAFSRQQFGEAKRAFETVVDNVPSDDYFDEKSSRMLAEIARRQRDTPRPTEEVAGLIWGLQNARATRPGDMGGISWSSSPQIQQLVKVGDQAMDGLIDALEKDDRLTLTLSGTRSGFTQVGRLGTVRDAALWLIQAISQREYYPDDRVGDDGGQSAMIAEIRADWAMLKGKSPAERIWSVLAQNGQKTERLNEAAHQLMRVKEPRMFSPRRDVPAGVLEDLLARHNPSVSDLLVARINELSERAEKRDATEQDLLGNLYKLNGYFGAANRLVMTLSQWDAPRAVKIMAPQLERTKKFVAPQKGQLGEQGQTLVSSTRLEFLFAQRNTPYQSAAMEEYGQWVSIAPFGSFSREEYGPLWRYPDEPTLQKALQTLFAAPKTPFQTAAQQLDGSSDINVAFRLLSTPLVKLPIVRDAIERELQNQTIVATVERETDPKNQVVGVIKVSAWTRLSAVSIPLNRALENGDSQPLRVADLVAYYLGKKATPGASYAFEPLLDVSLPQKERDTQIQKIIELVRKGEVDTK